MNNPLKKEFKSRDVNRARNLITKDFSAKTVEGIGYQKAHVAYNEGDIWEESGRTWTIKDGIKQNITKLDKAKKALQTPLACPKCGGTMNYHLHEKMYKIHKMCYDCVIDYEGKLRVAGLYDRYEKAMVHGGLKAFAKDLEQYILDELSSSNVYVTEQGDVEDWNGNDKANQRMLQNVKEIVEHIRANVD